MQLSDTTYREVRLWRAADDGHFFLFVCLERLPQGGFLCPYAAKFRNWQFMSAHMEDLALRHDVFAEMGKPQTKVFSTAEEAADAFDLQQAVEG